MAARILHIFPSLEVGGMQRRFADIINRSTTGWDHRPLALDGDYTALEMVDGLSPPEKAPALPKNSVLQAAYAARHYLTRERPNLLITYNWGSVEFAMANRWKSLCPMIHVQDGFGPDEVTGELPARRRLRRWVYTGCDRVIVPSHTLAAQARSSWRIAESKVAHIANGVDCERFKAGTSPQIRAKLGIADTDPVIGTVAALRPEKDVGRLIEAFSLISDRFPAAHLMIVGDGVGRAALEMLVQRTALEDSIHLVGHQEDPLPYLRSMAVFALSSDTEQLPLSLLEAMGCGLPIASTDVGDIRRVVSDDNQCFIDGWDAQSLAASLNSLLSDEGLRHRLGQDNRLQVEDQYSVDEMVASYERVFAEALAV